MRRACGILPASALAATLCAGAAWPAEGLEPRMISVLGEGETRTAPDTVSLVLRLSRENPKPTEARRLMAETAAAVIDTLRKEGIPSRNIQTYRVSLNAQYKHDRGNQTLTGYRAATSIRVKLDNLKNYDQVVEKALDAGASELAGLEFSHSNIRNLEKESRKKAVDDALEKAKAIAQAAGARLGRVHRVSEEAYEPPYGFLRSAGAAEEGPRPSIAEGEIVIRIRVRASWELLD